MSFEEFLAEFKKRHASDYVNEHNKVTPVDHSPGHSQNRLVNAPKQEEGMDFKSAAGGSDYDDWDGVDDSGYFTEVVE